MPWSNQNGGGWKGGSGPGKNGGGSRGPGPGGPWGSGGGNQPPDLEDILKRGQDRLKQVLPGGSSGLPPLFALLLAAVAVAVVAFYAFTFRVNQDEVGVVLRFGQFVRQENPGLRFRLPPPIEEVLKPKVTRQNTTEISKRGRGGGDNTLMLTGDENFIDVPFVIYWSVKPDQINKFLFNIQNQETTVKEVGESAMREVVGKSNLQGLLTEGRQKTEAAAQKVMQDVLDFYGAGIRIDQVQLGEVGPPAEVNAAFQDVANAAADRERSQKEGQTYANQSIQRARGDAERILQEAQGYRDRVIAEANGQTSRFLKIYEEYKKAPEVTRKRMFIEMQERVLTGADKIILDKGVAGQAGAGVVPFLPLDQLRRPQP